MTVSLALQVILFVLSAALPVTGLIRLYINASRRLDDVTRTSRLVRFIEGPAAAEPLRTMDVLPRMESDGLPFEDDRAELGRELRRLRADLLLVGGGVVAGAVASIWSLLEASL